MSVDRNEKTSVVVFKEESLDHDEQSVSLDGGPFSTVYVDADQDMDDTHVVELISAEPDIQAFVLKDDDDGAPSFLSGPPNPLSAAGNILYTASKNPAIPKIDLRQNVIEEFSTDEELEDSEDDGFLRKRSRIELLLAGILDKLEENNQKKDKLMEAIEENNKLLRLQNGILMKRFNNATNDGYWHEVKLVFDNREEVTLTVDLPTLNKIQKGDKETIAKLKEQAGQNASDSNEPSINWSVEEQPQWPSSNPVSDTCSQPTDHWPHQAVLELIDLYKQKKPLFNDPTVKKMEIWKQIAQELSEKGFFYTGEGAHSKMRALKFRVKSILKTKSRKKTKKKWRYLELMQEVLSDQELEASSTHQEQSDALLASKMLNPSRRLSYKMNSVSQSDQWTHDSIVKLIGLYRERKDLFNDPSFKKMDLWHQIALQMEEHGFSYTTEACYNKMRCLKFRFKRILYSEAKSDKTQPRWKYFDMMEDIMASEVSVPSIYAVPTGEDEIQTDQWSKTSVFQLIETYYQQRETFNLPGIRLMNIWKKIAHDLSTNLGQPYTWEGCHTKMRQLKFRYKKICASHKEKRKWDYFAAMEKIMSEETQIQPLCVKY